MNRKHFNSSWTFRATVVSLSLTFFASVPAQALGLVDLLTLTFQGNPGLQSQERLVQASQADVQGALYQFFPTPTLSSEQVNAAANDINYNRDKQVTTLRLQQPIWTGGRLTAGFERAQAASEVSRANMEEVRQQLALRAIQTWGEWKAGQQKLIALQESVLTHQRLRDLILRRVAAGASASADEILAQGRLEQTQAEYASFQAQVAVALVKLEQLTGRPWTERELAGFAVSPLDRVMRRHDVVDAAWRNSPALQKLQAQVRLQEHELQIKKAQMLPEVYVRAERQQGNFSPAGLSSANRIFLGLSASPGAGLSLASGIDAAAARVEAAKADIEVARRGVAEQASIEQASGLSQLQRSAGLQASLASTQAMVKSWDRQFLAGRKTWVEVMNAARELAQSQTALADVSVSYVVSTWRLAVYSEGLEALLADPAAFSSAAVLPAPRAMPSVPAAPTARLSADQ